MTRTIVIVGASLGLGRAAARTLARDPANRVIVAGRDLARTTAAVPGATAALRVDLADLADVRRFTDELAAHGPIHAIICNAGIQTTKPPAFTRDGFEETFAVNHLAHVAIVMRALPFLAPGARVVFIGSGTMDPADRGARRFGFRGGRYTDARSLAAGAGDPTVGDAQRGKDRYATSKQCNLLAVNAIARRVPAERLAVFALDPGLMPGTGLARDRSWIERLGWHTILRALPGTSSARRSGKALAWLATDRSLAGATGRYYDYRRRELEPPAPCRRADWADELYDGCLALAGIATDPLARYSVIMPSTTAVGGAM
jgi:NAD(P)-dependent dehydrogenase (short-subunit alcohol dehydrogenase family)